MTISIGDKIPDQLFVIMDNDKGPQPFSLLEFSSNKKLILFGVPGAFTPTCTRNHLPGFIKNTQKIGKKIPRGLFFDYFLMILYGMGSPWEYF